MKTHWQTCKKIIEVDISFNPNAELKPQAFCSKKCWPDKLLVGRFFFVDETDIYDENGDIKP